MTAALATAKLNLLGMDKKALQDFFVQHRRETLSSRSSIKVDTL